MMCMKGCFVFLFILFLASSGSKILIWLALFPVPCDICVNASALTSEYFFLFLCLEILPDSQPYVGHGKCGEMGGRSPGIAEFLFLNVCAVKN